ncbi:hypothetical protein PSACC_00674 [Paramicrosporidium saccamoebae]|uniref:Uncharacterized protein n=1 Tax=Paramicrosporidium saccamoebae TaxID=1246581 RepID=A0A2H9TP40_9FUNG|nr:hypothetical protein PSACC_00674 [Paramicrosporidium saccamoebae]
MDQFKKNMYRPVLKTVRPGEQKKDTPRFDFSKKFAELIKKEASFDSGPTSDSGNSSPSNSASADPPPEFKPANAPKLNLQREGLLNMKYEEPKPSIEAAVPTSSVLDLSSEPEPEPDTKDVTSVQISQSISHTVLDEAMYDCRSKLLGLESQLSILEGEMPVAIGHLDEQIGNI